LKVGGCRLAVEFSYSLVIINIIPAILRGDFLFKPKAVLSLKLKAESLKPFNKKKKIFHNISEFIQE